MKERIEKEIQKYQELNEKKLKALTDEIYPAQLDVLDVPAYMPDSDSEDEIREYMRQSNRFSDETIARADESFCYGFGCARDLIFSMLKKKFWDAKKTHPVIAQPCEDKIRYVSKSELNDLCKDLKKYVDKLGIPSDELAMLHNYIDNIYDLYSQTEDIPHIQTREDAVSRRAVMEIVTKEFVDLQDGTEEWRNAVNDIVEEILHNVETMPPVLPDPYKGG